MKLENIEVGSIYSVIDELNDKAHNVRLIHRHNGMNWIETIDDSLMGDDCMPCALCSDECLQPELTADVVDFIKKATEAKVANSGRHALELYKKGVRML